MAINSNKLVVSELDFLEIKAKLIEFFQAQTEFSDYNFTGAGLNVFMDILAYNTHYNAWIANISANEMFLDSSALRESVVSHAKLLDYIPASRSAAHASLDFVFTPGGSPTSLTIEKGTKFTASKDGTTYNFVTPSATTIIPVSGVYSVDGVEIKEGTFIDFRWIVDKTNLQQRFVLPSSIIDVSTLTVSVQASLQDNTTTIFSEADDINYVKGTDAVYWIFEAENNQYELQFGDGTVGKALEDGNVIKVNYLVTSGPLANDISSFSISSTVAGLSTGNITMTVASGSAGGAERETIKSIKFLAPKNYQSQGRAVTEADYTNVIKEFRTDAKSVKVWGGEKSDPPQYGKVFIALKPNDADIYSNYDKEQIINEIVHARNVVVIRPEIVDPDYTYIKLTTTVKYNPVLLIGDTNTLTTKIRTAIETYFDDNLSIFDSVFRYSVVLNTIDSADASIRNNYTTTIFQKRIEPTTVAKTYTLNFNNAIKTSSLISERFTYGSDSNCWLADAGNGIIKIYHLVGTTNTAITSIGTINYSTGKVVISGFAVVSIVATSGVLNIDATPTNYDITSTREQILTMDTTDSSAISLTLIAEYSNATSSGLP